jgi:JAB1/Mov34/MPN/PAD-1 ubiquitin protease
MPAKAKSIMPGMTNSAEFGFVSWSAPEVAWTIEYPIEVMEEIRAFACDELLQLSHGGAEVGGVMYGSQRSGAIRILTWRPIASEYAEGETLRLSHRDRMNLAVQLEVARGNPELKDLRPVGWFVSHPSGRVAMTSSDLEVHNGFFPERSQVTLVIHPTGGGRAEAGFFVRSADGSVQLDASYQNFILSPLIAPPAAASDTKPESQETPASESNGAPASAPAPSVAGSSVAGPSLAGPSLAARGTRLPAPDAEIFKTQEPLPARERWQWAIPIVLALGLAAWLLYISVMEPRGPKPAESSPIAFHVSSNAARTVQLEWDRNSQAVRDSDHAEIDIADAGKTSQVVLSGDQLHSGRMAYVPQSGDVEFRFTVYPASGAPVHDSTRLIAPAFSAPSQPPELLGTPPPSTGDEELQRQVRQLREELSKERARSGELQNLNRILENRLGIQPEAPKTGPQP